MKYLTVLLAVLLQALPISAQNGDGNRGNPLVVLHQQVGEAFDKDDYQKAAELCERGLELSPAHPLFLYNAACAYTQLGDKEKGINFLFKAVKAGFVDFEHMESDPDLDPIREDVVYKRIVEARKEAYKRLAERQIKTARGLFGEKGYLYETDHERHLNYATALDEVSHKEMRVMVERQFDQLIHTLFDSAPRYYVLIAVPTPAMASNFLRNQNIGGMYEHEFKRLIARDIGVMLRHELTHLVHFGHMERLGQNHPLWIHEGIAALYETYDFDEDGKIIFKPNKRLNIIKNIVDHNVAPRWSRLFTLDAESFMARSQQNYPAVRSIFRFLYERGKLVEWYETYVEKYEDDRSGKLAFETIFEEPLEKVERRWRHWVKGQSKHDDRVRGGEASLGIQGTILAGALSDGVLIGNIFRNSAAAKAGIRVDDVIVAIDNHATRSFDELVTIIASKEVGDTVRVRLRRGDSYMTIIVVLQPLMTAIHLEYQPTRIEMACSWYKFSYLAGLAA